ncbi:thioredoxin family protein [Flavobacterium sp. MFBS3-15]|uniref:thioredoxin family protein n=1 Tax=Flavobacterium sp. MFBS3-15 TaxID=2989816 RepID=UPI002235A9C4|nr:thioredoxin family protein [Flavobacterium sp. MFBS3-15]MCW4468705.1 thioredoxin family protein [Flavobacterium sp. MFBS3-15]
MKKILLALFIGLGTMAVQAQEIKWMTMDEALAAQKKKAKPIFMDVYTDWCGPCKMLDKNTFSDPAVAKYISDNFYAVKFNAEGKGDINFKGKKYSNPGFVEGRKGRNAQHEFASFLQVQGYPSMIVFNAKGAILNTLVGYYTPELLLDTLKKNY